MYKSYLNIINNNKNLKYKTYNNSNYREIPQIKKLSKDQLFAIDVVSQILPFKTNSYYVEKLINWDNVPDDPMFLLTFPLKRMLLPEHFNAIAKLIKAKADKKTIKKEANKIRLLLNPHPDDQLKKNIPEINGEKLWGTQHKYHETILFFPSQGQNCHAYCSFCFRWAQFVGIKNLKIASKEINLLFNYVKKHKEITDLLLTGGDPLMMSSKLLEEYIDPLLTDQTEHLQTIRIGTKALSHWPYRFLNSKNADDLFRIFDKVNKAGKQIALMAHINHTAEIQTPEVQKAIKRIRSAGVNIRTQSPLLNHINNKAEIWEEMWREQTKLGLIPYYMFIARDTSAQHYFSVDLESAWKIFKNAYKNVSGLSRTVRGPSMSTSPGKIEILGVTNINNEKVFILRFIQARNTDWVGKPFFAKYDKKAIWLNNLIPAFNEKKFFWTDEFNKIMNP